jgi:imidazolonepropionase-like amidohydrolase
MGTADSSGGTCTGEEELRRAVAARAERGCDVVKVMATGGYLTPAFPMWDAQFSVEELRIVVAEAHRVGLPVAAHCHGIVGIEGALDAGADTIEHCSFYSRNARPEPDEALLARLAASGVAVAPTLGRLPDPPLTPELAAHRPIVLGAWRRLHELGATLVAGTDAGIVPAKPSLKPLRVQCRRLAKTPCTRRALAGGKLKCGATCRRAGCSPTATLRVTSRPFRRVRARPDLR